MTDNWDPAAAADHWEEFRHPGGTVRVSVGGDDTPPGAVRQVIVSRGALTVLDLDPDDAQEIGSALIRAAEAARRRQGGSGV
jgi:hypothetical protein